MSDPPVPPVGRAGRARGRAIRARTQEELDAVRMPGAIRSPPPVGAVVETVGAHGRGRATTPDSSISQGRGRGVTPERDSINVPSTGRGAFLRGALASQTQQSQAATVDTTSSVRTGSSSADSLVQPLAQVGLSASSITTSGAGGGNGSAPSIGRGATRGRRDRQDFQPRTRPETCTSKQGSGGDPLPISCNFFRLVSKPDWRLLKYRVDMSPEIDFTKLRKALVYQHKGTKLKNMIFDGTLLFTDTRLAPTDDVTPVIWTSQRNDGTIVTLSIRLVEELQPSDYHYMQFFNLVLRRVLEGMKLELVGRNYYDPSAKIMLTNHKLELWPGYETSIRQHEDSILLCCEISHKILRTDTVYEQISNISRQFPRDHKRMCEKTLLGSVVMTRYNNKTYKIDDINWDMSPLSTFPYRDGQMSYVQYYETKYNRKISDNRQPLMTVLPSMRERRAGQGPTILVPELCFMTGLSDEQRANFNLMKDMGNYTRQDPKKKVASLQTFAKRCIENPETKKMLDDWKLSFNTELVKFRARLLKPETILGQGNSSHNYKTDNADWGGAFRNWKQWSVVNLSKWVVIHAAKDAAPVKEFVNSLMKVSPSLGMVMKGPKVFEIPDNRTATYIQQLDKAVALNPQLVMVVIPNNKGEHYAAVKTKCCVEKPIPSQCMTATVLGKPKGLMSVATKVALQMNCKLGGEPWAVKIPLKNTMILGYDTYHDTVAKNKSVGALVASLNATFTRFISSANLHEGVGQELDNTMKPAVMKALRKYKDVNGTFPERIIMYRDGVGDGQIPYVLENEVAAIEGCFKAAGMENIKFTFIIVSKRIMTRFFTGTGSSSNNPHSGTIVDDVVTLPERYDFFLVSQSVRQGTVNPTSYNVLRDTSGLKPEHIQALTYKLCHLYYNWPGTVRVPMVCQYAHKLALLIGDSLHRMPAEGLDDLLYYL